MTLGKTFKALSDPQRREILELIKKNYRMSAGEIADHLGVTPQSLSYHLKLLKECDLAAYGISRKRSSVTNV